MEFLRVLNGLCDEWMERFLVQQRTPRAPAILVGVYSHFYEFSMDYVRNGWNCFLVLQPTPRALAIPVGVYSHFYEFTTTDNMRGMD